MSTTWCRRWRRFHSQEAVIQEAVTSDDRKYRDRSGKKVVQDCWNRARQIHRFHEEISKRRNRAADGQVGRWPWLERSQSARPSTCVQALLEREPARDRMVNVPGSQHRNRLSGHVLRDRSGHRSLPRRTTKVVRLQSQRFRPDGVCHLHRLSVCRGWPEQRIVRSPEHSVEIQTVSSRKTHAQEILHRLVRSATSLSRLNGSWVKVVRAFWAGTARRSTTDEAWSGGKNSISLGTTFEGVLLLGVDAFSREERRVGSLGGVIPTGVSYCGVWLVESWMLSQHLYPFSEEQASNTLSLLSFEADWNVFDITFSISQLRQPTFDISTWVLWTVYECKFQIAGPGIMPILFLNVARKIAISISVRNNNLPHTIIDVDLRPERSIAIADSLYCDLNQRLCCRTSKVCHIRSQCQRFRTMIRYIYLLSTETMPILSFVVKPDTF